MTQDKPNGAPQDQEEFVGYLERDQLETETDKHVPRVQLSLGAQAGLWALRIFVVIVSVMVIYTFISQLH